MVSKSRVTWATSLPTTDRQMSDAHHRLMSPPIRGGGIIGVTVSELIRMCYVVHVLQDDTRADGRIVFTCKVPASASR